MAITAIAALETAAAVAPSVSTEFTTVSSFVLYCDGFLPGENAILYRLGPSAAYEPATNDKGTILVSGHPNMVRVDAPGTFRVGKTLTASASVSVGYEAV